MLDAQFLYHNCASPLRSSGNPLGSCWPVSWYAFRSFRTISKNSYTPLPSKWQFHFLLWSRVCPVDCLIGICSAFIGLSEFTRRLVLGGQSKYGFWPGRWCSGVETTWCRSCCASWFRATTSLRVDEATNISFRSFSSSSMFSRSFVRSGSSLWSGGYMLWPLPVSSPAMCLSSTQKTSPNRGRLWSWFPRDVLGVCLCWVILCPRMGSVLAAPSCVRRESSFQYDELDAPVVAQGSHLEYAPVAYSWSKTGRGNQEVNNPPSAPCLNFIFLSVFSTIRSFLATISSISIPLLFRRASIRSGDLLLKSPAMRFRPLVSLRLSSRRRIWVSKTSKRSFGEK